MHWILVYWDQVMKMRENNQKFCPQCGRALPFEDQRCPYCGGAVKKKRKWNFKKLIRSAAAVLLPLLLTQLLYQMIANRYLTKLTDIMVRPEKGQELVMLPAEKNEVICYGESLRHYAMPEELEWEIRRGFWNKEVNWGEDYPGMTQVQRDAMEALRPHLKFGSQTEDQVLAHLMDAGCTREEAEQALAICPIDFEHQAAFRAAGWLKTSSVSRRQMLADLEESGFPMEQAEAGLDLLGVDWVNQARLCVMDNLGRDAYSRDRLLELLVIWGFSPEQAAAAMENCIADWNLQAEKAARRNLEGGEYTYETLVTQLESEKFTHDQAVSGALAAGLTENKNP